MTSPARFRTEPRWLPLTRVPRTQVPAKYLPWLLDSASLTQRLIELCAGEFRVQVLSQGWVRPLRNESRALGLRRPGRALVRQVHLLCAGAPWVFARTVIPRATLTGPRRRLAHLRARSLGAVLFSDPSMRRDEVEIARLTPADGLFAAATQSLKTPPEAVWGRRAVFRLSGRPLLVSEFFLPPIADLSR